MARNLGFALPDDQDIPSTPGKLLLHVAIALHSSRELVLPEIDASLRHTSARTARVAVPKAAMYEDSFASMLKCNVWLSGHVGDIYPIAVPETPQGASNSKFGSRIMGPNEGHLVATLFLGEGVRRTVAHDGLSVVARGSGGPRLV